MHILLLLLTTLLLSCTACSDDPQPDPQDQGTSTLNDMQTADLGDAQTDLNNSVVPIGEVCRSPRDCVEGALCVGNNQGQFLCMRQCDEFWRICDDGSLCIPVATGDGACYIGGSAPDGDPCTQNIDCAPGRLCLGDSNTGASYCMRACHELDNVCQEDEVCRLINTSGKGYCQDALGARCSADQDCIPGLQCSTTIFDAELQYLFPEGYCTIPDCNTNDDCPGDSVCRPVGGDPPKRACLDTCDQNSDCRFHQGYQCFDQTLCQTLQDPTACEARFANVKLCHVPTP